MVQFQIPTDEPLKELRLPNFIGGLNVQTIASQLKPTESPDMLNINYDERGAIQKRYGYKRVYDTSLGTGQINALYDYYKIGQSDPIFLVNHGTKVYKDVNGTLSEIYSGLTDAKMKYFTFNDVCYGLNGSEFVQYDGTTYKDVEPYIPTITLGRTPDGTAYTDNEEINLLTDAFTDSFSGDGTATEYYLSYQNLTSREVVAVVDGNTLTEDVDFMVDRTAGKVTFDTPPSDNTDNVKITAGRPNADPTIVTKCTLAENYGGKNDTRTFYAGHSEIPNLLLHSGLFDPTYIPESGYILVGSDAEKITNLVQFYDYLVILKERSIWVLQGATPNEYRMNPINDKYGCIAPDSVQLIENNVVFLSESGVCLLGYSTVREYINVVEVSDNIDKGSRPGLLNESNLEDAVSVDYDSKYWLCLPNGTVYLWDYVLTRQARDYIWLKYDNYKMSVFLPKDGTLYMGSSENGLVFKEPTTTPDREEYSDDGEAINAYWTTKLFYFDRREWEKYIHYLYFSVKINKTIGVDIYYQTDNGNAELVKSLEFNTFSYDNFSYDNFQYSSLIFPPTNRVRVRKKGEYFQVKFSNNTLGEGLSLLDMVIIYELRRQVK